MTETTTRKYEAMLVLQPGLLESAVEKKLKEFEAFLAENHGKVVQKENWGKRKLAYRIQKHDDGIYVNYLLELPASFLKELDEHLRIHVDIIRSLVTSVPSDDYELARYEEESPLSKKTFSTKQKHPLGKRRDAFKTNQVKHIDHKDVATLKHFVNGFQKIKPRYYTGVQLMNQKKLARAIKQARHLALLPFVN